MTTELLQPPCMLVPWSPYAEGLSTEYMMVDVWARMHREELYGIVFHENPKMSLAQFIQFFSRDNVLVQLCVDVSNPLDPHIAGMVWLADFEQLPSHRRGVGSFLFFKDYWSPRWTTTFGKMALDYWFNDLKLDCLLGLTPKLNRAAQRYSRRLGIRYIAELPNYTSFNGQPATGLLAMLTRAEYEAQKQQEVPCGQEQC